MIHSLELSNLGESYKNNLMLLVIFNFYIKNLGKNIKSL